MDFTCPLPRVLASRRLGAKRRSGRQKEVEEGLLEENGAKTGGERSREEVGWKGPSRGRLFMFINVPYVRLSIRRFTLVPPRDNDTDLCQLSRSGELKWLNNVADS